MALNDDVNAEVAAAAQAIQGLVDRYNAQKAANANVVDPAVVQSIKALADTANAAQ